MDKASRLKAMKRRMGQLPVEKDPLLRAAKRLGGDEQKVLSALRKIQGSK